MEMPVPYSIYPEVSEKGAVWAIEKRCARDSDDTVAVTRR